MTNSIDRRSFTKWGFVSGAAALSGPANAMPERPTGALEIKDSRKTHITILLYDGITMLDWIGPYEALHRVAEVGLILAPKTVTLMTSDSGMVEYKANVTLDQIKRTDVLIVPGGAKGMMVAANDPTIADWIKRLDLTSRYTGGICTGTLM